MWFIIGFIVGVIVTILTVYWLIGKKAPFGKTIQYHLRIKAGLQEPKDFSQGHGDRRRGRHK